ncbi:MAG TPA: hypothetical protein G4O13_06810 [Dehalococcoidia bacterium]|nr:hypothetical protein [Dehalococcoidia bacterium]
MTVRTVNVMEEDWDYLIVLDACRYDYFERVVDEFFVGQLEKRVSQGASTPDWLRSNFPDYYHDVVYVSANTFVNSKVEAGEFDAKRHFPKIVDVCLFGWDDVLGTVPPRRVVDAALDAMAQFPRHRLIIHFVQPHEPYLAEGYFVKGYPPPSTDCNGKMRTKIQTYGMDYVIETLLNLMHRLLLKIKIARFAWTVRERSGLPPTDWLLRQVLGLRPILPMDAVRRRYGKRGLREAYAANIRLVLRYVAVLSHQLMAQGHRTERPRIVITSDHGEMLGEDGRYGHCGGRHGFLSRYKDYPLIHVPWFTVEAVAASEALELSRYAWEKGRIQDRVEGLRQRGRL